MKLLIVVFLTFGAAAVSAQPAGPPVDARKLCVDAMNADPVFAQSIAHTLDKQLDQKTIDAHNDANFHIAKNERHVIYAYAAMWVIAAAFLMYLWRRQQALKSEIGQLRSDLDAAAKDAK